MLGDPTGLSFAGASRFPPDLYRSGLVEPVVDALHVVVDEPLEFVESLPGPVHAVIAVT